MRKGGGKAKGASFEREVCHNLSRFVDPRGSDTLFWRSAMSGGRATVQRRKGVKNMTQLGDITCVHEAGHWLTQLFYIECKFYKDLDLASGLLRGKGKLAEFWKETVKRANECEREPLLIARQNLLKPLVIFSYSSLIKFKTFGHHPSVILTSYPLCWTAKAHVCFYEDVFLGKKRVRRSR